ncbi:hypothetical protein H9W90_10380 [Polaribacter pectinis]|uniref:Uncharacterized protein n=1 Tax=Polaribacter pectinis TaxID=2738844 RepID=A0A7G9L7K4_9FLAO|nr:hypothetical protein [Polaribacter pectinis]QNM84603.1 hypothetical protein H9W90_10380 [Polaribacter pectinis]
MSKKTVQNTFEIYELLRAGLMYPSIVYIPIDTVLEYVEFEEIAELQEIMQPFDRLWICESLEINYHLEADTDLQLLLKKQDVLKKNLFLLIDYKQNLEPEQFEYLEKNYKQLLYVCMYFSQEMLRVLKVSKEKHLKKYLHLFELQDIHYQKHFTAIEETFPSSEEEKKTWYTSDTINYEKLKENIPLDNNRDDKTSKKVKKKRQKYITDEESQMYLLESVFNIKID